ncbi:hypothetical protein [Phenylobacterium sp.]|uniref:hypothetical protein n=1 Tax=Phenylobacterium sp. TaxID=1871053 RepID=UPI002F41FCBB
MTGTCAQAQIFGPETLHGIADVRVSAADGEKSWLYGGFGKTAVSGDGGGVKVKPRLAEAALEWKPRFSFAVSGVLALELQPQVHPAFDVSEAYLKLQAPPSPAGRISGRVGYFYPPVSMEHDGTAWTTPDMLSASALNSWIGEEVKVVGAEGTITHAFGRHEVSATAAVFGWNDTSGTLLSFRGWALHGIKAGWRTDYDLPPLSAFMATKQAEETYPRLELDNRVGYYGRLEWRPPAPVSFNALYYDNVGNRIAVENLQWAWETRFLNIGMRWDVDERTKVLAQAMNGETLMGYRMPGGIWVDVGYRAAYLLASRGYGAHALSGRIDWFETNDRTFKVLDNNDEEGWALTGAWRHHLASHADLVFEAQHVSSKRPSRALAGTAPKQSQNVLQTALRLSF